MDNNQLILLKNKVNNIIGNNTVFDTGIYGMQLFKEYDTAKVNRCFHTPFIILMLNGEKHSLFGSKEYIYGPGKYVVASVDFPVSSYISNISNNNPYLSILLPVNQNIIVDIISRSEHINVSDKCFCGISIADIDDNLLSAFTRLIDLIGNEEDIITIAPMIVKEIHYRILKGPIGASLRDINTYSSKSSRIMQAVQYIKEHYNENIKMDYLASIVNMALSTFNRNFRIITTLSPLQYQKRVRLYEAQRLMLTKDFNVTSACFEVGYSSIHQFNREYKKLFGEPPYRNIKKIITG